MSSDGLFHRRHLLAEARRFLVLVQRGRRREPGLDETIVNAAIAAYCLDITEPKTTRGLLADYRLCTARWAHPDPARARRRSPEAAPDVDHRPPADLTALYEGVTAHQQAAMPEQLLLFPDTDVEEPEGESEPTDYMERLRALQRARAKTGTQDLTTEQISIQARIEEMKTRAKMLRERYEPRPEAPAPRPVLKDQEHRQHPGQPSTGHGGASR
ncbi:hypothetical protein [Streptomyces bikiniensis]|uniref:hypothetical protein n=1 Tax=Streptomyces bikiniensis TaxID=1896 RepID=UPI00131EB1C5|nr:hypothetical protein [Streptomyces bikiniensis]